MTTNPAPLTHAQARINADAITVVRAHLDGVKPHKLLELINQAESPNQAVTLRLIQMVAELTKVDSVNPAGKFAEWETEAFDAIAQFDAARAASDQDGETPLMTYHDARRSTIAEAHIVAIELTRCAVYGDGWTTDMLLTPLDREDAIEVILALAGQAAQHLRNSTRDETHLREVVEVWADAAVAEVAAARAEEAGA